MKRLYAFFLVIAIALMPLANAFASAGDVTIDFTDRDVYFSRTATDGSTVYFLSDTVIYAWTAGAADVTGYRILMEELESEDISDNGYVSAIGVYCDNGEVYAIVAVYGYDEEYNSSLGSVYGVRLKLEGETAMPEIATAPLDWEPLTESYDYGSYARYVNSCTAVDGVLYITSYGDIGSEAFAVPLNGKYASKLEDITEPVVMGRYKDGALFFLEYDYNKPEEASFVAYDPASDTVSALGEMEIENYTVPNGLVYSEKDDAFYFCEKGSVVRYDMSSGEKTAVNDIIASNYSIDSAYILDNGFYAACSYNGFYVRNTDPDQRSSKRIMICNSVSSAAVQKAYPVYTNEHGDVSVGISNDYIEDSAVTEAMLNRVSDFDIYVVSANMGAYSACFNRGYTAEMTGNEKIDAMFAEMYPSVAKAFSKDGVILAVPVSSYSDGFGVSAELLEKIGLTMEDIPSNWEDFVKWIPEGASLLEGKDVVLFDQWMTDKDLRWELFTWIFLDYMKYLTYAGQEQGYNTDMLYSLLKSVEDLDLSPLGLREAQEENVLYDESGDEYYASVEPAPAYDDGLGTLFTSYVSQTSEGSYGEYVPMAMSMTKDTPFILQMEMNVAFVNPFSENRDEAIAYLGYIIDNLEASHLSNISPERNEPVRSRYYETEKAYVDEQIADLKKLIEECSEEEKQALEASLADMNSYKEYIEERDWEVSPEGIEWLRAHDDTIVVSTYNPQYSDEEGVIGNLLSQYMDHSIDLRTLLSSIDKKVQMMYLEEN